MLKHRLQTSLYVLQVVAAATLMRSIAFDRWISVIASVLLIVGALAAQRGRTWGVGLALATAAAFPVAFAVGIAPAWFCFVGIIGAIPFMLTARPFARFDKAATVLLATLATVGGTATAIGFKAIARDLFHAIPLLRPSQHAHHGLALAATLAIATGLIAGRLRAQRIESSGRVRIGDSIRVARPEEERSMLERQLADEAEDEQEEDGRKQRGV